MNERYICTTRRRNDFGRNASRGNLPRVGELQSHIHTHTHTHTHTNKHNMHTFEVSKRAPDSSKVLVVAQLVTTQVVGVRVLG
jgi:hypothetical protein